ncbi:MAG: hypothetical protein GY833_22650 [Aestuariibacter sp.]|nr:hypothetical protein [Aestuariibacter sp.]|tara:strand:- start:233751 stop:234035 length:285 start_codon:yes stop_codon:yes gene_type:complete
MRLTPDEEALILKRRAEEARVQKRERFYGEVVRITALWHEWSLENGEGLTFSTFVNQFEAPEHINTEFEGHLKAIYEAVRDVLNKAAAHAHQIN